MFTWAHSPRLKLIPAWNKSFFKIIETELLSYFHQIDQAHQKSQILCSTSLIGKRSMQSLNFNYRKKNKPTDVLSFPVYENFLQERPQSPIINLGDIYVCQDVALKQANEYDVTPRNELVRLIVHGYLHLLGFDHEQGPREARLMEAQELKLQTAIQKKLSRRSVS